MMERWFKAAGCWMIAGAVLVGCGEAEKAGPVPVEAGGKEKEGETSAAVDALVREADAFLLSGDYAAAMGKINRAIELEPGRTYAYEVRGFLHERLGAFDKAAEDYTRAMKSAPESVEPVLRRARLFLYMRRISEALADCDAAIALNPKEASTYTFRAALHLEAGDVDACIADCDAANDIDPELFQAYINRGIAYQRQGDLQRAVGEYTTAIGLHQDAGAYNNRGSVYSLLGKYAQAQADFTSAIHLDPTSPLAYDNRGVVHLKHQRADEAIADFTRVIDLTTKAQEKRAGSVQLGRRMARVYAFRAQAHLLKDDVQSAAADVAEGSRIDATDEDVKHAQRKVEERRK